MRIHLFIISIVCLFLPSICNAFSCPVACDKQGSCKREFVIGNKKITYYSNFPLNKNNNCIDQVIYVVHGTERNAESRYFAVLNAAKTVGKENRVLIVSPFFKTNADNPTGNEYYWSDSGWKQGNYSINNGKQISSFTVADTILDTIITSMLFPSLNRITVTGHSAGGQYTQLYALTTANPDQHTQFPYQFLVLNPSNYSYLNDFRPSPIVDGVYEQPIYWNGETWEMKPEYKAEAGDCPNTYDNYKYGLQERNNYASQFPTEDLIAQYIKRKVYYFLGEQDINPDDSSLDTSCPAKLQGAYRLKRGQNFYHFLNQYFPMHQHMLGVVPGVGHNASAMYNAETVKAVLFN